LDGTRSEAARGLQSAPDKDAVHDLRVAIRRCRSVAAVMREVDPAPPGTKCAPAEKTVPQAGRAARYQIMDEWVSEHGAENDKLRVTLHNFFQEREPKLLQGSLRLASKFDDKTWQRWRASCASEPAWSPGSLAAQCLAVERLNEAKELHAKALRADKPTAWHTFASA